MADWRRVVRASEVLEARINKASVAGLDLILLRAGGEVFAYEDACPHEGHPLSLGKLEADVLVCAKHLWEFEIRTGTHISRIHRLECNLKPLAARVAGEFVEVDVCGAVKAGNEDKDRAAAGQR